MAALAALQRSVVSPAGRHTASLIFLHGSGACFPSLLSPLPVGTGRSGERAGSALRCCGRGAAERDGRDSRQAWGRGLR